MKDFLKSPNPEVYYSTNYIVLDLEIDTSKGDYGHPIHNENRMLLACWRYGSDDAGRISSRWGTEYDFSDLVRGVEKADFLVCHNGKYELGWLRRMGCDLRKVLLFDTKLAEYVLLGNLASGDERMRPRSTSLDDCCRRRGWKIKDPVVDIMMGHGINPVRHPRPWLEGRCRQDVESTEKLLLDQRRQLANTGRLGVQLTRSLLTPVLADIEYEGMCLDQDRVFEEYDKYTRRYAELLREMEEFTGGINWRSPKQAGDFLYDKLGFQELTKYDKPTKSYVPRRTRKGNRLTDQKTLEALVAKTKEQKKFLALRKEIGKVNAAITKNLEFFIGICKEYGGVFHAIFNQTSTATHRLSSSGIETFFERLDASKRVQFQNLPRIFKRLFRARRDGWLIGEWDGSQLEFRVAVRLGGPDRVGLSDIVSGHDVHRFTASILNQVPEYAVTKPQRQGAKEHTFKPLYGGTTGTKRQMEYYQAFKDRYQGIAETQQSWVWEVLNSPHKCLTTPWGMRYYWPYASVSAGGYVNVTASVYNYPIQALATAEIIPIAIMYFWHGLEERGLKGYIKLVNTVHDSVICEIHPDYVEQFKELAVSIWAQVYRYLKMVYDFDFGEVPLGTGITIGTHWSEGEEEAYNVYSDGRVEEVA